MYLLEIRLKLICVCASMSEYDYVCLHITVFISVHKTVNVMYKSTHANCEHKFDVIILGNCT